MPPVGRLAPAHHVAEGARGSPSYASLASPADRVSSPYTRGQSRTSRRSNSRRYSRLSFQAAEQTDAVHKINSNVFDALSTEDIQVLFNVLEKDNHGLLEWREFASFLMEVCDPPFSQAEVEAIFKLTDQRPDGTVTAEEIERAFKHPTIKLQVAHMHQNFKVKQEYTISQGIAAEVKRDLLIDRLDWRVRLDDAFASLPFSTVSLAIFFSLVVFHLQIWNRQQVERGLEAWIEGYGKDLPGPYLQQAVAGPSSLWSWLSTSGISAVFGECAAAPDGAPGTPVCRLATRNVLIGDAQLRQARAEGLERAAWLLHSEVAQRHLAAQPADYFGAALSTLRNLQSSGWIDEDTDDVTLVFSTFNEDEQIFVTTEVTVGVYAYGYVEPVVVASAVVANPFPSVAIFVLDAVYICCILWPMYQEMRDLTSWCRMVGCLKGIFHYGGFWNTVDWMNIAMGVVQACNWVQCVLAIQTDSIQELLQGDDQRPHLIPHVMDLDTDALEAIRSDLATIIRLFFWLRIVMAANVFIIMLKFFKAFQANPKLQLVTNTLRNAASDIFHFCLVAGAVFVGYGVIGHIMFGGDLVTFNTLERSMNTAFTVLMGDFGWYVEASESDVGLASGSPWFLVVLWFWSFMVFNFLILMNMLMAIILEHYADCFSQVKSDPDAIALWEQAWRYMKQMRHTQGHVPHSHILCQLVDETQKAHPDEKVSSESLMQAFQMTPDQASLLMQWLHTEAKKQMMNAEGGQDKQLARLIQIEGFLEGMAEILRIISLNVSQCSKQLQEQENMLRAASDGDQDPAARPVDGTRSAGSEFAQQLQTQDATMEDLNQVAVMLRDAVAHLGAYGGSPKSPNLVGRSGSASPRSAQDSCRVPPETALPTTSCCVVQKATKKHEVLS